MQALEKDAQSAGAPARVQPFSILTGAIGALAAVVGIVVGVQGQRHADSADVRTARASIVADTLQMAEYNDKSGSGSEAEITLLAADAAKLVQDYGAKELALSATTYRLIGQLLTYSTSDLTTAESMLEHAEEAAQGKGLEEVWVWRLRGDAAAQLQKPEDMADDYERALAVSAEIPDVSPDVDTYTRIYRLLDAYLGAHRAKADETKQQFCALADEWASDLSLVAAWESRPHVHSQITARVRVDAARDLPEICSLG
jgi:hypothetical protein